jgi:sugar/nucleoside kinase (ribokinase family)
MYMGMLGDDEYGRVIIEGMRQAGIDTSALRMEKSESSPFSFVLVDSKTGGRSIVHYPGCRFRVPADCVAHDSVRAARLVHVDMAAPAVFAACETATKAGVPISVDANLLFPHLEELLETADIFIPAQRLARELSGEQNVRNAGEKLMAKYGLKLVVITCGEEGSAAVTENEYVRAPGFSIDVVDTTGAGDVFHGACLYAYLKQFPLKYTLAFANAAAALMCTSREGWTGIPTRSEIEEFLRDNGVKILAESR